MVVLEAAAISAAGYGVYKGGEAGIRKGKEVHKEMKREQNRSVQRNELGEKGRERSQRISHIMSQRRGSQNNIDAEAEASKLTDTSRSTGSDDVKDRHRAVMDRLRQSRREEAKKSSSQRGLFKNPFKKK
ncbi:MAG: hypothetical protein SGILL_010600 [Bacillariaceae sp.]